MYSLILNNDIISYAYTQYANVAVAMAVRVLHMLHNIPACKM